MTIPAEFIRNLFDYYIKLCRLYDFDYTYAQKLNEIQDMSVGVFNSIDILGFLDEFYSYYDTYIDNLRSSEND